jgi:TatD DNase family protein
MLEKMEQLLTDSKAVAVGECGLDRSKRNHDFNLDNQILAFKMQLELAMKLKLPLVLHIREAEDEALRVLEEVKLPQDWPIHRCRLCISVSNIILL